MAIASTTLRSAATRWAANVLVGTMLILLGMMAPEAQTADPPSIMVVLDGSGSMWARLGNERTSKLLLAREALRLTLPKVGRDTRIGIASFGHRRPGECSDIETLVRPQAADPGRVLASIEKLNPKGRGPVAQALREAAREVGTAGGSGSVLLLHDDLDNCQQDPCAAAAEINRALPRIAIHVISLGMRPDDVQRMSCVAQSTGGKIYDVQTADELNRALEEAFETAGASTPTLMSAPKPVSREAKPAPSKPGLHLSASLASSTERLDVRVRWRVARADDRAGPPVYQGEIAQPTLEVASGRYDIEARLGLVSARVTVDIDARASNQVNVPLDAGTIRLSAQTQRGGRMSADPIFSISKPEVGAGGSATGRPGDPLLILRSPQSDIALQPGPYVVSVTQGLYRVDRPVMVAAGSRGRLAITLPTGELELQATATSGGPPLDDAVFQVFEDDPDAPQGRRELARSAASRPSFTLAAGTYYVVARHGTAEARERMTVRPGELERRSLVTGSARLTLIATIAGDKPDSSDSVVGILERLDGAAGETVRTTRQGAVLNLAPGRYRVESRLGVLNARAEREIELRPGAQEELMMEHRAGVVRLALIETQGALPLPDVFWEVKDDQGRIVWITSEAQPVGILQAGRYAVRAEARDRRVERWIDVRAGDNRAIEILAQ